MDTQLYLIQQKICAIQFGILRVHDQNAKITLQVKTSSNIDNSLNCLVTENSPGKDLVNKHVNLIQKHHNDYLYITGQVADEVNGKGKILSIRILKACWFVKRSKGSVSWLQEKYIYERFPVQEMELAS